MLAVVLQTTLFVDLRPFDVAPNLVVVVVIGAVRFLDPEPAVLFGFTGGLLMDLLGDSPLGMWALVVTLVAFAVVRLRSRAEESVPLLGGGVLVLSAAAELLFVLLGTLFGQRTFSEDGVVRIVILTAIYNTILAAGVLPGLALLMKPRRRTWAV